MEWHDLLEKSRWAALGSVDDDARPFVSNVAFAPGDGCLLIHVSQLAAHTRNLLERPVFSLLISEPDVDVSLDPQTLARLTISGIASSIPSESDEYTQLAKRYIARFPDSQVRFGFGDFHLIKLIPDSGNFVGGFGSAKRLKGEKIAALLT